MKLLALVLTTTLLATTAYAQDDTAPAAASSGQELQKKEAQKELAQLPADKAKAYNDAMQKANDSNKELRSQIHKAYEEADMILTAEKFDKKAFLAKAVEIDALYDKTRINMNSAFVGVAENFTQEERKILLKTRNERRKH